MKILFRYKQLLFIITTCLISSHASAAYLGLRVQSLPVHVKAHLPEAIGKNQGIIVDWLEDISPAADHGIKLYDVLLSHNEQPITTVAKFQQMIDQDKAGQKIQIKLLRQGVIQTVEIIGTEMPSGEKMTPQPKKSVLYIPNPSAATPRQVQQFQPRRSRQLNIAGQPAYPMRKKPEVHSWGTERNIWPDFYTDGTNEMWDKMINAPFKMGRMPGGWRAPSLSMPDPVTIGDAVTNQMPPMAEEMGNMVDISD